MSDTINLWESVKERPRWAFVNSSISLRGRRSTGKVKGICIMSLDLEKGLQALREEVYYYILKSRVAEKHVRVVRKWWSVL